MCDLPPLQHPRPGAGSSVEWDTPVGYGHAASILSLLNR
jgi:hypothetical protein